MKIKMHYPLWRSCIDFLINLTIGAVLSFAISFAITDGKEGLLLYAASIFGAAILLSILKLISKSQMWIINEGNIYQGFFDKKLFTLDEIEAFHIGLPELSLEMKFFFRHAGCPRLRDDALVLKLIGNRFFLISCKDLKNVHAFLNVFRSDQNIRQGIDYSDEEKLLFRLPRFSRVLHLDATIENRNKSQPVE